MGFSTNANYNAISLTGTQTLFELGNGVSASTVHQIYCLSTGVIQITPMIGSSFFWSGTTNQSIDVVPRQTIVSSGTFIGFKSRFYPNQNSNLT